MEKESEMSSPSKTKGSQSLQMSGTTLADDIGYARLVGRRGSEVCLADFDATIKMLPCFIGKCDMSLDQQLQNEYQFGSKAQFIPLSGTNPSLSRHHARIYWDERHGGCFGLEVLSKNGVRVNKIPYIKGQKVLLRSATAELRIAGTRLFFTVPVDAKVYKDIRKVDTSHTSSSQQNKEKPKPLTIEVMVKDFFKQSLHLGKKYLLKEIVHWITDKYNIGKKDNSQKKVNLETLKKINELDLKQLQQDCYVHLCSSYLRTQDIDGIMKWHPKVLTTGTTTDVDANAKVRNTAESDRQSGPPKRPLETRDSSSSSSSSSNSSPDTKKKKET